MKITKLIVVVFVMGLLSFQVLQAQNSILEKKTTKVSEAKGSWLKDPITGCGVWNSTPKGNEAISWSGECKDGKASGYGVLVWLEDGKIVGRFKGTMSNGKAEGRGNLDFEVEDGFANYDGGFRNNEMNGRGILLFPDGSRAEGDFKDDNMNGVIKASLTDGGSYEGEVKNNLPHGKGLQITPSGEEYFGEFVDGVRNGNGTLLLVNGDIYEGHFKNDLANGNGTLTTAEGEIFEGQFKEGMPNGKGAFTTLDGEVARGEFVMGEPKGKIVFTLKNGKEREEFWENGKKVQ